jgi:quercetin dioxygenase-like cupin family protein
VQLRSGDYYAIPLNTPHVIKAGPHGGRSLVISSSAGFAELIARAATPAHLAGSDT